MSSSLIFPRPSPRALTERAADTSRISKSFAYSSYTAGADELESRTWTFRRFSVRAISASRSCSSMPKPSFVYEVNDELCDSGTYGGSK